MDEQEQTLNEPPRTVRQIFREVGIVIEQHADGTWGYETPFGEMAAGFESASDAVMSVMVHVMRLAYRGAGVKPPRFHLPWE